MPQALENAKPRRSRQILLLGDYRWTLTFARSLAAAGHRVHLGRTGHVRLAANSRHVESVWEYDLPRPDGAFLAVLEAHLAEHPEIDLVIPLGDAELAGVGAGELRLPAGTALLVAAPQVIRDSLDKARMCAIAEELGIPQAPYAIVSDLEQLQDAAARIGHPSLVKPTDQLARIAGEKALILRGPQDLARGFSRWPAGNRELLIQGYATGPRHNVHVLARHGELLVAAETKALRTTRADYTGYTVDGVSLAPSPDLVEYTRALVAHLGFHGLGCAQFLVDPATGAVSFLELSPRLGAAFAVTIACGIDFPRLAVESLEGPVEAPASYPAGRRIAWCYGDLQGLGRAWKSGEIGVREALAWGLRSLRSTLAADIHATWSLRDPKPTLALYLGWFPRRVRALFGGGSRQAKCAATIADG